MKHDGDASFISILIQFSSGSRAVYEHIAESVYGCENYIISFFYSIIDVYNETL